MSTMLFQIDTQTIKLELFDSSLTLLQSQYSELMSTLEACSNISRQKEAMKRKIETLKKRIEDLRDGENTTGGIDEHKSEEKKD